MTPEQLHEFCPEADRFFGGINAAFRRFGINTLKRQAMFLGQVAHESEGFRFTHEIWGPTATQERYEIPHELAKQLGNTQPGDGLKFKGRGLIQVTGRENVGKCSMFIFGDHRLLIDPSWLETPEGAAMSAGWFWSFHGLNELADEDDFEACTRRINGSLTTLEPRIVLWNRAKHILGVSP